MKHFQLYELVDKVTFQQFGDAAWQFFNPEALQALDDLRDFFNCAITINNWWENPNGPYQWRGFRTPEKAAELGAPHSQHALGNAFDCDIGTLDAEEARRIIIENKDNPLLSRIMRLEDKVRWVHFDLMKVPERIHLFKA
jgi:hypothetical protein